MASLSSWILTAARDGVEEVESHVRERRRAWGEGRLGFPGAGWGERIRRTGVRRDRRGGSRGREG